MDIKDSYLHGTKGVVKSISVTADKLTYNLADINNTSTTITLPVATNTDNGLLSSEDKKKLDLSMTITQSIPYIVGSDTTAGTWTGSYPGITAYEDGLTIIYVPNVAGATTTTLNINNLGAKTCYYTGSSKLTTHYTAGTPILLTYSNEGWRRAEYSQWTPYVAAYCSTAAATSDKVATCSSYTLTAKSYVHVLLVYTNTAQKALTLNINSKGAKPIYINGLISSASNYTLPAGTYIAYYDGTNFYFRTDGILPGTILTANSANSAGSATTATKLDTKRKLWGLDFDGSADVSGNMTGVGVINKIFKVTSIQDIAQLNVSEGSADINYSHLYVSSNNTSYPNARPLVLQYGYGNVGIGVIVPSEKLQVNGNVKATSFIGNLDGSYVNKLTGYTKATSAANLATTDTLNTALGKLEYKAHYAYDWVIGVTATDTDEYINKWSEIVGFLDSVKEGTDILDVLVTRTTTQTITGAKNFSGGVTLSCGLNINSTNPITWNDGTCHQRIQITDDSTTNTNLFEFQQSKDTGATWESLFTIKDNGNVVAAKFTTAGGTSSLFVKGDGSLDSDSYATTASLGNYLPLVGGTMTGHIKLTTGSSSIRSHSDKVLLAHANTSSYSGVTLGIDTVVLGNPSNSVVIRSDNTNLSHYKVNTNYVILDASNYTSYTPILNSSSTHATSSSVIYAPTTAGTQGLVLTSNGSGAPIWEGASSLNVGGAKVLSNYYSSRPTSLDVTFSDGGVRTFKDTAVTGTGKCSNPGHVLHFAWDNAPAYGYQLAMINADQNTHGIEFRGHNGAKWGDWYKVLTELNYTNYINTTNFPGLDKTGTVTSIKVGSTSYSPSSGVISLPAYPTSLKLTNVIKFKNTVGTEVSYDGSAVVDLTGGVNNATQLNGNAETSYLRYRGDIDTAYVDLTDTTANHTNFKKPSPGMYTIKRTDGTEMFVSFAMNTGSCSSLEFKVNYLDTARLFIRKVVDSNGISGNWRALAWYSDIPTSLKNPNALTIFGVNYDGSVAQTITANTMISTLSEGTSDVTDNTEILTSYASDNGFADINGPNTIYKRDAIKIYNYIKRKLDSVYHPKDVLGYIGTTAVQASSASQNLTGIGNLTMSGNLSLYTASGDSPAIVFQRGGIGSDTTVDWRMYVTSGNLKIQSALNSANNGAWTDVLTFGTYTNKLLTSSYHILPIATNTLTLGTSSLKWANVYATTFNGSLSGNASSATLASTVTVGTGSGDAYRPIVVHNGNALYSAGTATGKPCYNYSTGDIKAKSFTTDGGNFVGNLIGHASTATTLKPTTIISAKAFSFINTTWLDTGYTFESLATGTYAIQVTSGTNLVASGIMSVYNNLEDSAGDEIPLHVYHKPSSGTPWRPYLRTYANKLLISSNDASVTSRTVTIKIAQIL